MENNPQSLPSTPPSTPNVSFFARYSIFFKSAFIFFLILLLQIPVLLVDDLISERKNRKTGVMNEVAGMWAGQQILFGPVLNVPVKVFENTETQDPVTGKTTINSRSKIELISQYPQELEAEIKCQTGTKHRGIYDVPVYKADIHLKAKYNLSDFKLTETGRAMVHGKGTVTLGFTDMTGIDSSRFLFNGTDVRYRAGVSGDAFYSDGNGVQAEIEIDTAKDMYSADIYLKLKGLDKIEIIPTGSRNIVSIEGSWKNPAYIGVSPESEDRTIRMLDMNNNETEGFKAVWKYNNLLQNFNKNYSGDMSESLYAETSGIENSRNIGVRFFVPIDGYHQSERSVKYNILIMALTFISFIFIEVAGRKKKSIHIFQYTLVGLALALFYSLLLSFSEHLSFNLSYAIAGFMTVCMISLYIKGILSENRLALIAFGVTTFLYSYIFILLQLEDFALLAGSLGLFVILGVLMYLSRRMEIFKQD